MAITLGDLIYHTTRLIGGGLVKQGQATGGTTSTIIDTNDLTEADDYWNNGTAVIAYDAGGAGAAPQAQYSIISDYALSSHTISVRTAFTVAPASGDHYALIKKRLKLNDIIQMINNALVSLGPIVYTDTTTVVPAAEQTMYNLPIAANLSLRKIYLSTDTDTNDPHYKEVLGWKIERSAIGTADKIIFPSQPDTTSTCKLEYVGQHPWLFIYTDKLSEHVHEELVTFQAAINCINWYQDKIGDYSQYAATLQRLQNQAAQFQSLYPVDIPNQTNKGFNVWDYNIKADDR